MLSRDVRTPIRVTANKRSDNYSSVAYWYQAEPHSPFSILPVEQRVDRANT
jgi:hypothetical protein